MMGTAHGQTIAMCVPLELVFTESADYLSQDCPCFFEVRTIGVHLLTKM